MIVFYDHSGGAVAYSDDDRHIFLFSGEAVAYLDSDAVYSYRGELLGWFEDGWLRDENGRCVAFSEHAMSGPHRPAKKVRPNPQLKRPIPVEERQDPRALRPIHSNAWSHQSAAEFFQRSPQRWPGGFGGNIEMP